MWAGLGGLQQRLFLFIYLAWLLLFGRSILGRFDALEDAPTTDWLRG